MFNHIAECDISIEQFGIAYDDEMLTSTCHGHIQLAVYNIPFIVNKLTVGEKLQLVIALDGESVDDEITLRPLKAHNSKYLHML